MLNSVGIGAATWYIGASYVLNPISLLVLAQTKDVVLNCCLPTMCTESYANERITLDGF